MNLKQKFLTVIAIVVFAVTACKAPWRQDGNNNVVAYAPILSGVPEYRFENGFANKNPSYHLDVPALFALWAVIGLSYAGLFFVLKSGKTKH